MSKDTKDFIEELNKFSRIHGAKDVHSFILDLEKVLNENRNQMLEKHILEVENNLNFLRQYKDLKTFMVFSGDIHYEFCPYKNEENITEFANTCICSLIQELMSRTVIVMDLYGIKMY